MKVLVTDYVWPNLDREREILARVGAETIVSPSGAEADLLKLAPECDAILNCFAKVTPAVLRAAKQCLHVARYGIGVDSIAVDVATELGIIVTNVPDFCTDEVAEHTLGLMLACARKIPAYDRSVKSGKWDNLSGRPIHKVKGSTLGIIGYGKIARALVRKSSGLEMHYLAYDPVLSAKARDIPGVEFVNLDTLLRLSDFVSIHCPLTHETRGMIGREELRKMKPTAYLINCARGPIVEQHALADALREGWIAGAGLDVLPQEPPSPGNRLLTAERAILTPHAAFYSEESLMELQTEAAEEVARVLRGERPLNVVNPGVLGKARAARLRGSEPV
ncbi:MAG TPA: C-terminal binding protein [Chloroflexota bacterium]|nr:C-terminal binding protein [Chloroflexota bacterium]